MRAVMLCLLLLLTGCNNGAMLDAKARYACKDKGGVHRWSYRMGEPFVVCANGEVLEGIESIIIKDPEYYAKPYGGEL